MIFGRSKLIDSHLATRFGAAVLFVLAATLFRVALSTFIDRPISAPIFLTSIAFTTWVAGFRAGIFASILSCLALGYFFIQPLNGFAGTVNETARFFLFILEGVAASWVVERLRVSSEVLTASHEQLRQLSEQQRSAREDEQKRIAREIHDELGQALTGLKLDIHIMRKKVDGNDASHTPSDVSADLDDLSKRIDATIGTVRRISSELRPSVLDDFGLVAAIEWQSKEFERKSGVECIFNSNTDSIGLDADATNGIFRIFQEALTNVARHANASIVKIALDQFDQSLYLRIEDDGIGIDLDKLRKARSLGILGMRERARLIGAEIAIKRLNGGGTFVELIAPLSDGNGS